MRLKLKEYLVEIQNDFQSMDGTDKYGATYFYMHRILSKALYFFLLSLIL